jgi:2-succinyl-6-hydroxy-2,4-cyclohexadiene-1-carboxylate synthase
MLHGFMGSGAGFDYLISDLKSHLNLVRIDLLGHGKTSAPVDPERFRLHEQIKDLQVILKKMELDNCYLYGYSMGGRLALRLALADRNFCKGLILESTHEGILDRQKRRERKKTDEYWGRQILHDKQQFLEWWQGLELFSTPSGIPEERLRHYQEIQSLQSPESMAMSLRNFGQGSLLPVRKACEKLEIPVLLGAGEHDEKYIKRMSSLDHILPDSKMQIIRGASHRIHLDAPKRWAPYILDYIATT